MAILIEGSSCGTLVSDHKHVQENLLRNGFCIPGAVISNSDTLPGGKSLLPRYFKWSVHVGPANFETYLI